MAWKQDGRAVLQEPDVLSEDYLPRSLLAREVQAASLRSCLSPLLKQEKPLHIWLHGKPGTGKTATARFLAQELQDKSTARYVYVNCRNYNSYYSVLEHILNELRVGFGNARDVRIKLEKIRRSLGDRPFLIILDEVDFLPNRERSSLIYNLSFGKVGLVCISEGRDAILSLNGRTKSRFQPWLIEFPAYRPEEIASILRERALPAFIPGSWTSEILRKIATVAEGDVRAAIQILRSSAELADTQGDSVIREDHVNKAFCNTKDIKKSYTLKRLGDHYKILYKLIQDAEGILSNELWDLYERECTNKGLKPVAKRTYSYYLNRMAQFRLIEAKRARLRGHVYEFSVKAHI